MADVYRAASYVAYVDITTDVYRAASHVAYVDLTTDVYRAASYVAYYQPEGTPFVGWGVPWR